MATVTIGADVRRADLRWTAFPSPYWITSSIMTMADIEDTYGILFSFAAVERIFIHNVICQVTTLATAGTTLDIGLCTLATDAITTGGVGTTVDDDEFIKSADITATTAGIYGSTTGNTSDWLAAMITGSFAAPFMLTGAASTVPAIMAIAANAGTIAAGAFKLHMLITKLPA